MYYIANTEGKGRGLFAKRKILSGEVIERAPVIVIPAKELEYLDQTILYNYTFAWGKNSEDAALALGHVSIVNHSYSPNAGYYRIESDGVICYHALRDIEEGEEITVNYNCDPFDTSSLWFEVVETAEPVGATA